MVDENGVIIKSVFLRTGYNYDRDSVSRETGTSCVGSKDVAQQQFKDETDINEIVRRFGLTGEIPGDFRPPQSGDFTEVVDFHTAMNVIRSAEESFMTIPAKIRERFAHDPQKLMEFLADDRNKDEAVKLGLVQLPPEKTRDMITAIDEMSAKLVVPTDKK